MEELKVTPAELIFDLSRSSKETFVVSWNASTKISKVEVNIQPEGFTITWPTPSRDPDYNLNDKNNSDSGPDVYTSPMLITVEYNLRDAEIAKGLISALIELHLTSLGSKVPDKEASIIVNIAESEVEEGEQPFESLQCIICIRNFSDTIPARKPRILPECAHSFCTSCLEGIQGPVQKPSNIDDEHWKPRITCPACRRISYSQIHKLEYDRTALKMIDEQTSMNKKNKTTPEIVLDPHVPCVEDENHESNVYCQNCEAPYCSSCFKQRHGGKVLSLHTVLPVAQMPVIIPNCPVHKDRQATFICKNPDCQVEQKLFCHKCNRSDHRGHGAKQIEQTIDITTEAIEEQREKLERRQTEIKTKMHALQDHPISRMGYGMDTKMKIRAHFRKLEQQAINEADVIISEDRARIRETTSNLKRMFSLHIDQKHELDKVSKRKTKLHDSDDLISKGQSILEQEIPELVLPHVFDYPELENDDAPPPSKKVRITHPGTSSHWSPNSRLSTSGLSTSGPSTAGTSTSGPSTSGPSTAGTSTSGPSTSGTSTSGPSTAGTSTSGPSTSRPSTFGPSNSGPSTSGLLTAGTSTSRPSTFGPPTSGLLTSGPSNSGSSTPRLPTSGSSTSGPSTSGPSTAETSTSEPSTSGPSTAGTSTSGPSTSGPSTAETSTSEPSTSGPSTAGTSTSGPSTSGPSTAETSTSGPSTSGPSTAGTSTSGPATSRPSTFGPSNSGPSTSGLLTSAPSNSESSTPRLPTSGSSTSRPSTSGPSTAGTSTSGPSTSGPSTSGPSISGPSTSGPSTSRPSIPWLPTYGPSTAGLLIPWLPTSGPSIPWLPTYGPSTAGPSTAGPSIPWLPPSGPSTSGPSISGPSTSGPSTSRPSIPWLPTYGPSTAGPSTAGPSIPWLPPSGPSTSGPSTSGPSNSGIPFLEYTIFGPSSTWPLNSEPSTSGPANNIPA